MDTSHRTCKTGCDNTVCTKKLRERWIGEKVERSWSLRHPVLMFFLLLSIWRMQCAGNASHNNCRLCHKRYLVFKIKYSSFESMCRCEGCKDRLTLNKENMSIIQYRRGHVDTVEMSACEGLWSGLQVAICSYYIWFPMSCEKKINVCLTSVTKCSTKRGGGVTSLFALNKRLWQSWEQ